MNRPAPFLLAFVLIGIAPLMCLGDEPSRLAVVHERSADVMPFDLSATTHIFTKTPSGGVQRVVAKDVHDGTQTGLIRGHLREIADQFSRADFSAPTHVHGADMPGLAALKAAPAGAIRTRYQDIGAGAEISYSSTDPKIVAALHEWFDAQLADHGADAVAGHDHSMHHPN